VEYERPKGKGKASRGEGKEQRIRTLPEGPGAQTGEEPEGGKRDRSWELQPCSLERVLAKQLKMSLSRSNLGRLTIWDR